MSYALVIFDLDGTLADSFGWFLGVVNGVARDYGFKPIETGDVEALRRAGPRELLKRQQVPLWKLPAIARHMRALKRAHLESIPLFPGTDPMLRALSGAGITLALVSSDGEDNARRQLGASAAHFSHFVCGASLLGKAAHFKRAMRRAGAAPARTIAIGDEVRDIEAARAAAIACGAVTWGYAAPAALALRAPDLMFQRMDDIASRLIRP